MKQILKFTAGTLLLAMIFFNLLQKRKYYNPHTTIKDTPIASGSEYIYPDLIWGYDDEFNPYNFIFIPSLHFSFANRNIEVSIRDNNSAAWQTIPKIYQDISAGTVSYFVFVNGISITRTVSNPQDNMEGTKIAVKVNFL